MLINIIKIPTWPILTKRKFPAKQKQKNTWLELERRWSKILLEIKTSSPHKKRATPFSLADKERTWRRNIPAAAIPEITLNEFRRSSDVVSGMELVKSLTFLSLSLVEKKSWSSIERYFKKGLWPFRSWFGTSAMLFALWDERSLRSCGWIPLLRQ